MGACGERVIHVRVCLKEVVKRSVESTCEYGCFQSMLTFHSTLGQKILDWAYKYAVKEITALLSAEEHYLKCTYHFHPRATIFTSLMWLLILVLKNILYHYVYMYVCMCHGIWSCMSSSSSSMSLVGPSGFSGLNRAVRIFPNRPGFCCCRRSLWDIWEKRQGDRDKDTKDRES